ncbi:Uncharacterised protein [Mycobacteroides abscessus subsp. abscessus]|nr:Uncharacterised protein [Mycobacteroides abscessus subsp. abscessus]
MLAVTTAWSATPSADHPMVVTATPSTTSVRRPPAATVRISRMAPAASSRSMRGLPPSAMLRSTRSGMRTDDPEIGTISSKLSSPTCSSTAPVAACSARRSEETSHDSRSPSSATGLGTMRPAHETSSAQSTAPRMPASRTGACLRAVIRSGSAPAVARSSTTLASNRSSSSPTGSSTRVIPETATGPGMMQTASAP